MSYFRRTLALSQPRGWLLPLVIVLATPLGCAEARAESQPLASWTKQRCHTESRLISLVAPRRPLPGRPLHVLFVSARPLDSAVRLVGQGPAGELKLKVTRRGGPPYLLASRLDAPVPGRYRFALLGGDGKVIGCLRTRARKRRAEPAAPVTDKQWAVKRSWTHRFELLYSAWIELLFDAPPSERPTWKPLHQVTRDPRRNLLHNYLGQQEDDGLVVKPDCADFPYFLRAYFAWKLRLPFGYRQCSRGSSRRPPHCGPLKTNLAPPPRATGSAAERFSAFLRRRVSYVHSGAGRTAPDDDETDLYPLKLSRAAIRPGAVYVDPAGHLLVVARWVPQQGGRSGQLFAVESQPDLTVGRKRFWRGAFLFDADTKGGAGGFKGFRPLVLREGDIVALTNDEIRKSRHYADLSSEQYRHGRDGFYERVDRLINPHPLSPREAMHEQLVALYELLQKRVDSVNTGEAYMKQQGYKVIAMPEGPRIFQTTGAWEDYSTPARDFRLLVAMDQVLGFPARLQRDPSRFALKPDQTPATVARELTAMLWRQARDKRISYTRSDGASQSLTMAQVLKRRKGFEMAYNPNDCIERRWVAEGEELASCKRRAPDEQRRRMEQYRSWFATRTRPSIR